MAAKKHTIEEQAVIDARTQEVKTEKRNKNLMYTYIKINLKINNYGKEKSNECLYESKRKGKKSRKKII